MDKIAKFLAKLTDKERVILLEIMRQIQQWQFDMLDYKKLAGEENLYRVRKWSMRIIYSLRDGKWVIRNIDYRGSVYK